MYFTIGCYNRHRTSRRRPKSPFQQNSNPFCKIMCIDAPESTTNSRSSGLRVDAGRHLFSEGEKNGALFFSFNFRTHCWPASTLLRGHPCSCPFRLFLRPILKFWSIGVTLMRITWANHSKRWILVSNVSVTYDRLFVNRTHGIGFRMSGLFRKNVARLRRLHILKYAAQLSLHQITDVSMNFVPTFITPLIRFPWSIVISVGNRFSFMPITLFSIKPRRFLSIIRFGPFRRLFVNLTICMPALFPKFATALGLVEQAFWRVPLFTEWICASSSEVILARPSKHFTIGKSCL